MANFEVDQGANETPGDQTVDLSNKIESPNSAIMDAKVSVRFVVGSAELPLRELTAIQPSYVFETETPQSEPVTIELNGRVFGKGSLVLIGDRVGIQVTEFHGNG